MIGWTERASRRCRVAGEYEVQLATWDMGIVLEPRGEGRGVVSTSGNKHNCTGRVGHTWLFIKGLIREAKRSLRRGMCESNET